MHKNYKRELVDEIIALNPKHRQDFWKYINKLRKDEMVEEESFDTTEDWVSHFQNLLSETQESDTSFNFPNEDLDMKNDNSSDADDILETLITTKEIHDHISKLKKMKKMKLMKNDNSSDADDILETLITTKEIHEHISKLKTKKASSTDSILNEMIKCGQYYLVPTLQKLFNDILNCGTFPTEWKIGVLKPIYKKRGD